MTTPDTIEIEDDKSKHPILKKILIAFVVIYIIFYIISQVSLTNLQNDMKRVFIETNTLLLNQNISIDHVETSMYGDGSNIYDLKVANPSGFSSPTLIYTPDIRFDSGYSTNPKTPVIVITSVRIKNAIINYEINANKEVNVYKTLGKIISTLSSDPSYQAATILNSAQQPSMPLKYSGMKFRIGDVILEKPTINVYVNGAVMKKYTSNDLVLKFDSVKQPLQYGDALLAGSLQLVDKLDKIVRQ